MKKDFTENKPKGDKYQDLESMIKRDKCTEVSKDMSLSRSTILKSICNEG